MQKQPDSTATTVNPNSVETDAAELHAWGVEVPLPHSVMLTCCHCSLCLGHTSSTIGALAVPIAHPELCFSSRYSEILMSRNWRVSCLSVSWPLVRGAWEHHVCWLLELWKKWEICLPPKPPSKPPCSRLPEGCRVWAVLIPEGGP